MFGRAHDQFSEQDAPLASFTALLCAFLRGGCSSPLADAASGFLFLACMSGGVCMSSSRVLCELCMISSSISSSLGAGEDTLGSGAEWNGERSERWIGAQRVAPDL